MKRIKFSLLSILLIFLYCMYFSAYAVESSSAEPDTWTLRALYRRALTHAREIRIAKEQVYINRKDKSRAVAALIPDLTAFGQYTYNDEMTIQLPDSSTAYGAKISQSFTLNGRELVAFKMAKAGIEQATHDLTSAKGRYLYQVAAAYYQVLKFNETRKAAMSDVNRLEAHKEAVLLQLKLETIPNIQLYRTEAELSGSKTRLVQVENELHIARLNLASLVDLPEDFKLALPKLSGDVSYNQDELVQTALSCRSDLMSLRTAQKIAQENIRLSRGSFWPYLSLEGVFTRQDMDPQSFLPIDPVTNEYDQDSFSASASVVFPLFEGGLKRSELSQAKAQAKQAALQVEAQEKQVALEARKAYLDMATAKSIIESLQDQVTAAGKNYDAVTRHFKAGLANSLDVMDANTLLAQSEKDLVEARYNYELAIVNLKLRSGLFSKIIKKIQENQSDTHGQE